MSIESLLKNEGINIVRELNKSEIKTIAKVLGVSYQDLLD